MKKIRLLFVCFAFSFMLSNAQDRLLNENILISVDYGNQLGNWKVKNLENSFKKITENIYMAETEVTNQQYNYFLSDLLKQQKYDELMLYKIEKTDWRNLLPEALKQYPDERIFKYADYPTFDKAPVQNIRYESAVAFCEWLTQAYLKEDVNKRKWQKIIFRLPSEQEWMAAARSKKNNDALYPWGTSSPKNEKGCYLSNFNTNNLPSVCKNGDEVQCYVNDGGYFFVNADTYYPNEFGLYGMIGNVAEMVSPKTIAKGGSWEDTPEKCTIISQKKYEKPSPAIGFRILLEIVD